MPFTKHSEKSSVISADSASIFDFIDDHVKFSSHMNKSSWMMGGGKMTTEVDEGKGQKVGSHIKMGGRIMGFNLFLDEIVTERSRPLRKVWKTVGNPKLLVIGSYQMGVDLAPEGDKTKLKVFIDYDLPGGIAKIIGLMFGSIYANWCVDQMLDGVVDHFK